MVLNEAIQQMEPETEVTGVDEANEMGYKEADEIGAGGSEGPSSTTQTSLEETTTLNLRGDDLHVQQGRGKSK